MKVALWIAILASIGGMLYELSQETTNEVWIKLLNSANKINRDCPMMEGKSTRIDKVIAGPTKELNFYYTIMDDVVEKYKFNEIETRLKESYKIDAEMKFFRGNGVALHYFYRKEGDDKFLHVIDVGE